MPRGRGVDRQLQLTLCRVRDANTQVEPWERMSVREMAARYGTSKSTVHRYVNQDALNGDRRRSARRRARIRRGAHR